MKIVSFLPSATEMIFALGCGDRLLAVSHECDYPPEAQARPKAVKNRIPYLDLRSAEIDSAVSKTLRNDQSIYEIDLNLLGKLRPDLILTQELCDVCAVTGTDLHQALRALDLKPQILTQTPRDLDGILQDILILGEVLEVQDRAKKLNENLKARIERLRKKTSALPKPRVYAMEWLDPPYAAGHWVPELVALAGGNEVLGKPGMTSRKISWNEIARADPEVIVLMPCGFGVERAIEEAQVLGKHFEWNNLTAVRKGRVYAVDANAYFSRPGPRVLEGAELLAHLFFPEHIGWDGPADAWRIFPVFKTLPTARGGYAP